jgi:hypothetical protein
MTNWKEFGSNDSWLNQGSILAFAWNNQGKSQKP